MQNLPKPVWTSDVQVETMMGATDVATPCTIIRTLTERQRKILAALADQSRKTKEMAKASSRRRGFLGFRTSV